MHAHEGEDRLGQEGDRERSRRVLNRRSHATGFQESPGVTCANSQWLSSRNALLINAAVVVQEQNLLLISVEKCPVPDICLPQKTVLDEDHRTTRYKNVSPTE